MSTITLEVDDLVAERYRAASPTERMMLSYMAAELLSPPGVGLDYRTIREEFRAIQRKNGVPDSEWEHVFAELSSES